MPVTVAMPALSPTMEEGVLAKWLVEEGAAVKAGDPIAEIETDKATMEVEAPDDGVLARILVAAETEGVKVGAPIAQILREGEDAGALGAPPAQPRAAPFPAPVEGPAPAAPRLEQGDAPAFSPRPHASAGLPLPPEYTDPDPVIPPSVVMVKRAVRDALRDALAEEMRRDETVLLMGEEVGEYQGAYKVSRGLLEEFGARRVIDTPITEHGFTGLGVGAAYNGLRPVIEFMTFNFALQAVDHIINSAAKTRYMTGGAQRAPVVFRGPNGAAMQAAAQHSQDFSAWYAHIPGLVVLAPYSAADAKGLLKTAIRLDDPVVFLEHELLYGETGDTPEWDDWLVPVGKAKIRRFGADATIAAHSRMVGLALEAAEQLAGEGIECEVIDMRSLRPLDTDTVAGSVKKTNRLVYAEEGWGPMGVGAEVCAQITERCFDYLDHPPLRVHAADAPMPYAANLERAALPQTADIVAAVKKVSYR